MILTPLYRCVILALIASIVVFLSLNPTARSCFGKNSDEGYYTRYVASVDEHGLSAFPRWIAWYASSEKARIHPAPVRAGYIILGAILFKLNGHPDVALLAFVSTISFFIFLFVCFHYVRKYFDLDTALLTVLFLASSPLMMGLSRRALIDSPANLLWALTLWLFLDVLLKPTRYSYGCFLISLMASISFKESSLILVPFFVMAGLLGRRNGADITMAQIAGIVIYPMLFIVLFWGMICGGMGGLLAAVMAIAKTHLSSHYQNSYAINYCSGPWFRYLLDFLLITPITTLLFIGYLGYFAIQRKALDFIRSYFLLYFIFTYTLLSSLAHSKVVRFVVNLEMVMALFAVLMLKEIFKGCDERKMRIFLFYSALAIFMYNWSSFVELFYRPSLLDPITVYLLMARQFIPY